MSEADGDDTSPTVDDGLIEQLRRDGVLGPFKVLDWSGGSDVGLARARNEDRWDVAQDSVFVVADGIGGQEGGELAAQTAVGVAISYGLGMTEASASELAARSNSAVVDAGEAKGFDRLGATLVMVVAHPHYVVVLSVGDSRVYRYRDGNLEQLTEDHNVRNELLASGVPLEMATKSGIRLDALTSHVGKSSDLPIVSDAASYSIMDGDRYLLCSDGIHGYVEHSRMLASVQLATCESAVVGLLQSAQESGGRDNATAIVVEFAVTSRGAS